jgi:hypothetical protein
MKLEFLWMMNWTILSVWCSQMQRIDDCFPYVAIKGIIHVSFYWKHAHFYISPPHIIGGLRIPNIPIRCLKTLEQAKKIRRNKIHERATTERACHHNSSRPWHKQKRACMDSSDSSKLNQSYLQDSLQHIHRRDEHGQGSRVWLSCWNWSKPIN